MPGRLTLLYALWGLASQSSPNQETPVFRTEVNIIQVDVRVMDRGGNFVSDLKPTDFEIYEDGVLQEVATFQLVDLPMPVQPFTEPGLPPAVSDVATNEASAEGHIYALVLDDLHTRPERTTRVRGVARHFIEQWFGENDLAVVTTTGGLSGGSSTFTNNRQALLEVVEKFTGRQLRSLTLEQIELREQYLAGLLRVETFEVQLRTLDQEHAFRARAVLSHLRLMSEILGDIEARKKVILYIGEGMSYNMEEYGQGDLADIMARGIRGAIGSTGLSNVAIYALDIRGLSTGQEDMTMFSPLSTGGPELALMGPGAPGIIDPRIRRLLQTKGLESQLFAEEARRGRDTLRVLASDTGGLAALNRNDLDQGLRDLIADNRRFYQLGYTPPNVTLDGRFRKIEVKIKGRDLRVRARKGYIVPEEGDRLAGVEGADGLETELRRDLLSRHSPITGIPLRVLTFPFRIGENISSVAVVVESDIAGFRFTEQDGRFHDNVKVSAIVLDETGTWVDGQTNAFELTLQPAAREKMIQDGFRTLSVLEVPPGSYQLRLGVWEEGGEQRGSVFTDLNVPDPTETELTMGGVLLSSKREESVLVASATEMQQAVPFVPSTRREFTTKDQVVAGVQIFENPSFSKDKEVIFQTTVLDEHGNKVVESKSTSMFPGQNPVFLRSGIGLAGFAPGPYVIDIQGRDVDGRVLTRERNVFRVVGSPLAADLLVSSSYIDLLKSYSNGQFDEARNRLAKWTEEDLNGLVEQVESSITDPNILKTAVLMHTELSAFNAWGLSRETRALHLEVAGALIASIPSEMAFKRQWLLAVAAIYHGSNLSVSLDYLKEARRRFPNDADILLATAVSYEISAAVDHDPGVLRDAEKYYRRAIETDPDLEEAHLRLGRVLQQRGGERVEEAARELAWSIEHSSDPYLLYLANLFLGDLHKSNDDFNAAVACYRAAVESEPRWQTAYVSLSYALRANGDRSEARRVMQRAMRLPVDAPRYIDGYRLYVLGQLHNVPRMLDELRQGIMK
jgi:VWFA-related protein